MGRVGYLYESVKDQLKWNGLHVKQYVRLIMQIGQIVALSDDDYNKHKVEHIKMSDDAINSVFLNAWGDGK